MGVTCASFSLFGKIPESIDMFIIFVIGDKSDILPSFINLTEILSTPVAFLTLNLSMTLDTNVSLVDLNSKLFFYKIFIFNFLQAGMVIFIESIIFADVLGYIYEKYVKNFSYIYMFSYNFIIILLDNFRLSSTRFFGEIGFHGFPELSLFTATGASSLEIIIFRYSF